MAQLSRAEYGFKGSNLDDHRAGQILALLNPGNSDLGENGQIAQISTDACGCKILHFYLYFKKINFNFKY